MYGIITELDSSVFSWGYLSINSGLSREIPYVMFSEHSVLCLIKHQALNSALARNKWSTSRPGRFNPRETASVAHWLDSTVSPHARPKTKQSLPLPGTEHRLSSQQPNYTLPAPSQSRYIAIWHSKVAGVKQKRERERNPLYPIPLHSVRIRWQVSILVYLQSAQQRSRSTSSSRPSARKSVISIRFISYKLFEEVQAAFTSAALRQKHIKAHIFTLHSLVALSCIALQHLLMFLYNTPLSSRRWWTTRSGLAKFNPQEGHIIR